MQKKSTDEIRTTPSGATHDAAFGAIGRTKGRLAHHDRAASGDEHLAGVAPYHLR